MTNSLRQLKIAKFNFHTTYESIKPFITNLACQYKTKQTLYYIIRKHDMGFSSYDEIFCEECSETLIAEKEKENEEDVYITTEDACYYYKTNHSFRACHKCDIIFNLSYHIPLADLTYYWLKRDYSNINTETAWIIYTICESIEIKDPYNNQYLIDYYNKLTELVQILTKYLQKELHL
jgi:hypothetical protein